MGSNDDHTPLLAHIATIQRHSQDSQVTKAAMRLREMWVPLANAWINEDYPEFNRLMMIATGGGQEEDDA